METNQKKLQSTAVDTFRPTLVIRPSRVESADIDTWRNAVNSAKFGYREKLYDLYDNLMADGVLSKAVEKFVGKVTNAEICFQKNGKNIPDIDDLMNTPDFEELIKEIAYAKIYGRSIIELGFTPDFSVYSYPRKNCIIRYIDRPLSERQKCIVAREGQVTGYDYTKDDFFIECGKDDDLGLIFKAAIYVIYKRGGFGDWAQFAEIWGQPFLIGKYNSSDTAARDKLFEDLSKIGGQPIAAIPNEANIEVIENKSPGSSALYKDLRSACNEEILIAIQGETMTTLSGSSRSQAEVHQDTDDDTSKTLRRYVQRILNKKLIPLLIKRGYNVAGGKFTFPEAGEELSITDKVTNALNIKKAGVQVDDDYFYEITDIPKPKVPIDQKPVDQPPVPAVDANGNPIPPTDVPPVDTPVVADKSPKSPTSKKKPGVKLSDTDKGVIRRLVDFFVQAPASKIAGANRNLTSKSTNSIGTKINLSENSSIDINALISRAITELYNEKGKQTELVNRNLFEATYTPLSIAITKELLPTNDSEFIDQFNKNTAVFAAFKNHLQTKEIVALLTGEDGKLRSFSQFKKLALQVSEKYNVNWLQTEYNQAVRSARIAANLKGFEKTLHLYPNLEYIHTTAAEPDSTHLDYVGTILPFSHPWWRKHMPPSRWGCCCSVAQSDKEPTEVPDGEYVDPQFQNNPADTASFVNMEENPYYTHTDEQLRDLVIKEAERLTTTILKEQRTEALVQAKKLVGKTVYNKEAAMEIGFTVKGIKEAINNPFVDYQAKLEAMGGIDKVLKTAKYAGSVPNNKPDQKPAIIRYHYFDAKIGSVDATIVVQEDKWGKNTLYSITENKKTTE